MKLKSSMIASMLSGTLMLGVVGWAAPPVSNSQTQINKSLSNTSPFARTGSPRGSVQIGFVEATQSAPYYVELQDAIASESAKLHFQVSYANANNSVSSENNDIMNLLTKGIKLLIIDAVNPEAVAPAIAQAKRDHVPVIAVDRPVSVPVTTFVGRNNKQMGQLVGQYTKKLLNGKSNALIYEIQGAAGDLVMMARRAGFDSVFARDKNVKIQFSSYDAYVRSEAIVSMTDFLAVSRPNLNVVYAHNDDMGIGAYQVLTKDNLRNVNIVSIDGMMQTIKLIMDGTQYKATCLNDPAYQGTIAVEAAQRILQGKPVPKFINVGTKLITKANAKKFYNPKLAFASYEPPIHW